MSKAKKSIDWSAIERDYRKTGLSIRELARWYGCDDKAIRLKAKAGKWVRPGADTPQPAPQAPQAPQAPRPLAALIEPIVQGLRDLAPDSPAETHDIVERSRRVAMRLVDELDAITTRQGELAQIIDEALEGKDNAKQRESLRKMLSLSDRAMTLKNLALTVKTLAEAHAPAGKKAAAAENAKSAGIGSEWGDDLAPPAQPSSRPN